MIQTFEPGDTRMFTFVSSIAPDAVPVFAVLYNNTLVASFTAAQSDSTHYYALYTMPSSQGYYLAEWTAQKTFSGSSRNFGMRHMFQVKEVRVLT